MVASFTDWDRDPNYLAHFGVKGMKHGQRRYQNPDGSLTALGRERYGVQGKRRAKGIARDLNKLDSERAYAQYRAGHYGSKIAKKDAKYAKKIAKAEQYGDSDSKRLAKLKAKREGLSSTRAGKKATKYSELLKQNKSMTNKILESAERQGMDVKGRRTIRQVNKGRALAKGMAIAGAATLGSAALQGHMSKRGIGGYEIGNRTIVKSRKGIGQRVYDLGESVKGARIDIGKGIKFDRAGQFLQKNAGAVGGAYLGAHAAAGGAIAGKMLAPVVRGTKYKVKKRK